MALGALLGAGAGAGLGASLLGAGVSMIGANRAANAQENAAAAQLALAREQMGIQQDVYDRQLGVLGDTRTANTNALNNLYRNSTGAERNLLAYGRGNARDMYQRNNGIARDTFADQRGQFRGALDFGLGQSRNAYNLATGAARTGFNRETGALAAARDANIAGFQGYADSGDRARALRDYEMGLASSLPSGVTALSMSPAAQFALQQGRDTVEAGAMAGGSPRSGATMAALEKLRMGMAAQDRETQLNRLAGITDQGMMAQGAMAGARDTYASGYGNASRALSGALTTAANNRADTNIGLRDQFAGRMGGALAARGDALSRNSTALGSQLQSLMQQYTNNMQALRSGRTGGIIEARNNYAAGAGNAGNIFANGASTANQFSMNALANMGDARAAGATGVANAFTSGLQNWLTMQRYNQLMNPATAGSTAPPANPYY